MYDKNRSLRSCDGSIDFLREYSDILKEECFTARHTSGLKILVSPKKRSSVSAVIATKYGAVDIDISRASDASPVITPHGVAHFLEHQLFATPDGHDAQDDFSMLGSEVNAYTTYDKTAYTFACTESYERSLELLLKMVSEPSFKKSSVDKERGIITEEIRMNADSPWERCYSEALRAMYSSHPVREDICGTERSIADITPEILYKCHKRFYAPPNMALAVSGDVDPCAVIAICDRVLDDKRFDGVTDVSPKRSFDEPYRVAREYTSVEVHAPKTAFCIGIKNSADGIAAGKEMLLRELTMSVLFEMLFSRTAPLYNSLFEKGMISPDFSYGSAIGEGFSFVTVSGEADEPDAVYDAFLKHLGRLRKDGLSRDDFLRNRRIMYADFVTGFDSTDDIANTLMNYALDGISPFEFINTVSNLRFEDVCELFEKIADDKNFVLSVARASGQ